jgi:NADP-dependent 3-hydroxy acid dehydrogenase YdfG
VVSVVSGFTARPGWGSYAASKFALRALADALRAEESGYGVRVTSAYPGRTDTDMQRAVVAHEGGEYDGSRFLRPESVARAVHLAITTPPDADVTELSIRPARADSSSPSTPTSGRERVVPAGPHASTLLPGLNRG